MSRLEELLSASLLPQSTPIQTQEIKDEVIAGQVNELVKGTNLSHPTSSLHRTLSSENITAPASQTVATADLASKYINMGEIKKSESADAIDKEVGSFAEKVNAFDQSVKEAPLTAETAIRKINVAWEILQLGLQLEQRIFKNLEEINDELTRLQEKPKAILALQQKFINKKEIVINEEIRADLAKLKDLGVDLGLDGVEKIPADKLESLKTVLDGHKSQAQSDTQKQLMNYQHIVQQLGSMHDSMKIVIKHQSNLIATITQNMSR